MEEIHTDELYEVSAPLSQAIRHHGIVYVSGAVPIDPDTDELVDGGVGEQTEQVMENLATVLDAAGTSFDRVVRARVFLADMDEFGELNEVYEEYVTEPYPARTAVKAEMARPEILVEIDVTATVD